MSQVSITKQQFDNLQYDAAYVPPKSQEASAPAPTILFVFDDGDRDAAIYHLTESLKTPLAGNAIRTVLVQESARKEFVANLCAKLPPLSAELQQHAGYQKAADLVEKLKFVTLNKSPIVSDVWHEQLGGQPNGLVTLHTFRTLKEAAALAKKETTVAFTNASIWSANVAQSYGLLVELKYPNYFINCHQKPLAPLKEHIEKGASFVVFADNYSYTTLPQNGVQKSIVFPYGTTFAN